MARKTFMKPPIIVPVCSEILEPSVTLMAKGETLGSPTDAVTSSGVIRREQRDRVHLPNLPLPLAP